jgi:hypothetical protein
VATDNVDLAQLEVAVARARGRAAASGELHPKASSSAPSPVGAAVGEFVERILTDGTYARTALRIGEEDPDLATI